MTVGVFGFSQGAITANILAVLHQREDSRFYNKFKFVITCSGMLPYDIDLRELVEAVRPISGDDLESFHFIGNKDSLVKLAHEMFEALWKGAPSVQFAGGHTLPTLSSDQAGLFTCWLREQHTNCVDAAPLARM
eukprot:Platyproteum_vivax@DN2630_c0_g1_i1.p1